ncbi:MAG: hydrolase, partial [Ilumatobacteraceae bacterium]
MTRGLTLAQMLLAGASAPDGSTFDTRLEGDRIIAMGTSLARLDEEVVDLRGHLLLGAFAEPHAHLDKAFLADRVTNPSGDLLGAIQAMQQMSSSFTPADIVERAERAARLLVANGASLIRSHVDTTSEQGLRSIEALLDV